MEPITTLTLAGLSWIGGTVAAGAAGGVAGNVSDRVLCRLTRGVMERTAGLRGLPENHDVARAVRLAQAQALERLILDHRAVAAPESPTDRIGATDPFHDPALAFCRRIQGRCRDPSIKLNLDVSAPLDWAMTQNNLGLALSRLGERENGTARLEQAVAAYRLALEEWTRDRVPLAWATTQSNLGNALFRLGEREGGTASLEAAVAAYQLALEECTRDRVPLDWAMTQTNLGFALACLGEREDDPARVEQAVLAHRAALEVFSPEDSPAYHAVAQENLEAALAILARLRGEG